jgi:hypothetical protein
MGKDERVARDADMLYWKEKQMIYMNRELNRPRKMVTCFSINKQTSG